MNFRRAESGDAGEIARLSDVLGYPAEAEVIANRLGRILSSPADAVFVAESSPGKLAGWIHGFLSQLVESEFRVEIGGLVVDPAARRHGVGRRLVEGLAAWARERGAGELGVRCRDDRSDAHGFYESLGFRCVKTQKVFRRAVAAR